GSSRAGLPVLPAGRIRTHPSFPTVEHAAPPAHTLLDSGIEQRDIHYDVVSDKTTMRVSRNDGAVRLDDIGTTVSYRKVKQFSIARNDPLTADAEVLTSMHYQREGWDARLQTRIRMTCDRKHFFFRSDAEAFDGGERCFSRNYAHKIRRDNL